METRKFQRNIYGRHINNLFILSLFIFFFYCCTEQHDVSFAEKIINDNSRGGMFLVIQNKLSDSYYVLTNDECLFFYKEKYGWSNQQYKTYMLNSFREKGCFQIEETQVPANWPIVHNQLQSFNKDDILHE